MRLQLLRTFGLRDERGIIDVPSAGARVLALLAIQPSPVPRALLAGTLWPERSEGRAAANLRSVLWRLDARAAPALEQGDSTLSLSPQVSVDLSVAWLWSRSITSGDTVRARVDEEALFSCLLPGWGDQWLVSPRLRWRQQRLHALDTLCELRLAGGHLEDAVELAERTFREEPTRESAVRNLATALVARGQPAAAVDVCRVHRQALLAVFGLDASRRATLDDVLSGTG